MKKTYLILLLLLILILAACSGTDQTTASNTEPAAQTTDTPKPISPTSEGTEPEKLPAASGDIDECTVVGLLPPIDPTQQALFPAVSEDDWVKGPQDADITIVEYSDFQ
ncbi:MAG: hypothetical protein U9R58_01370 [Chloroflexota bacterium]|nr:hypothetical protein [Chloroflexota bacterium]